MATSSNNDLGARLLEEGGSGGGDYQELSDEPGSSVLDLPAPALPDDPDDDDKKAAGPANKMGTYLGVIQPCLLNIFGAIIFLRLSWAVGEAGWLGVVLMFCLSGTLVVLTALSVAAISTNGNMGGGGAYYMISRSLGPEFGVATGILYYLGCCVSVTFYISAFTYSVHTTFLCPYNTTPHSFPIELCDCWADTKSRYLIWGISSGVLLVLLLQAMVGASFVLKLNTLIFAVLVVSIAVGWLSFIADHGQSVMSAQTFADNALWDFTQDASSRSGGGGGGGSPALSGDTGNVPAAKSNKTKGVDDDFIKSCSTAGGSTAQSFLNVFIIIFPAVTGIMAGANYSGNLLDPGKSVGPGTLRAIVVAIAVYLTLALTMAGAVDRDTLKGDKYLMQHVAFHEAFIVAGVFSSTISSALGQLDGSARVLQTMARDQIIAWLGVFKFGSKGGDDPRVALILSWAIAQACVFIPSLDQISALVSGFYILVYFFINVSCFAMRISGAPNFRPRFKYFSWQTALLGALLAISLAFATSPLNTGIAIIVWVLLCVYVFLMGPVVPWGDVSQALIYHQVRKYLLKLDERRAHPKFWRPALLVVVESPRRALKLMDFCNNMKKGGLYVIGQVVPSPLDESDGGIGNGTRGEGGGGGGGGGAAGGAVDSEEKQAGGGGAGGAAAGGGRGRGLKVVGPTVMQLRTLYLELIDRLGIKAFCEVVVARTARLGYQNLALMSGMGGMKANTIVIQYPEWPSSSSNGEDGDEDGDGGESGLGNSSSSSSAAAAAAEGDEAAASSRAKKLTKKMSRRSNKDLRERAGTVLERMDQTMETITTDVQQLLASSRAGALERDTEGEQEEQADGAVQGRYGAGGGVGGGGGGGGGGSVMIKNPDDLLAIMQDMMAIRKNNPDDLLAIMQDMMAIRKNVLLARHFDKLNKDLVIAFHRDAKARRKKFAYNQSRMTVDIWTFTGGPGSRAGGGGPGGGPRGGPRGGAGAAAFAWATPEDWDKATADWSDLRGTLALQLQLAYTLHRVDVWWANTALRVVAVMPTADPAIHRRGVAVLEKLLSSLRIDADVTVLAAERSWVGAMGGPAGREAANGGRMAQMAAAPAGQGSPLANLGGDGLEMGRAGGGQGGEDGDDDDNDEQKSGLGPASTTTQRSLRRGRVASDVLTHYSMEPLNELIRRNSINCCLLFMPLPTDSKERL
eukprot:g3561.t1